MGGCADVATFASPEGAAARMLERVARGDRVLVKGSRGMRMERAVRPSWPGSGSARRRRGAQPPGRLRQVPIIAVDGGLTRSLL